MFRRAIAALLAPRWILFNSPELSVETQASTLRLPTVSYGWAATNTENFGLLAEITQGSENNPTAVTPALIYTTNDSGNPAVTSASYPCSPIPLTSSSATAYVVCDVKNTKITPGYATIRFEQYPTDFVFSVASSPTQMINVDVFTTSTRTVTVTRPARTTATTTSYTQTATTYAYQIPELSTVTSTTHSPCQTSTSSWDSLYATYSLSTSCTTFKSSSCPPYTRSTPRPSSTTCLVPGYCSQTQACNGHMLHRRRPTFTVEYGPPDYTCDEQHRPTTKYKYSTAGTSVTYETSTVYEDTPARTMTVSKETTQTQTIVASATAMTVWVTECEVPAQTSTQDFRSSPASGENTKSFTMSPIFSSSPTPSSDLTATSIANRALIDRSASPLSTFTTTFTSTSSFLSVTRVTIVIADDDESFLPWTTDSLTWKSLGTATFTQTSTVYPVFTTTMTKTRTSLRTNTGTWYTETDPRGSVFSVFDPTYTIETRRSLETVTETPTFEFSTVWVGEIESSTYIVNA